MHLILSSLGTVALFVRKRLILSGVVGEETGVLVHTVAARLSEALGVSLVEQVTDSPLEEILTRFSAETPNSWLPEVSATDVELLSPDDLASKYNLIRATFYSDDRVITGDFFGRCAVFGAGHAQSHLVAVEQEACERVEGLTLVGGRCKAKYLQYLVGYLVLEHAICILFV